MKIIGITGKSGSGKTTLATLLAEKLKCKHIDIDKIGHQSLLQPEILDSLYNKFGTEILDDKGNLDRKKLGNIVFSQKHKMKILTDLTWNYMEKILDDILSQNDEVIILDWILLPHSKYWHKCYSKILTTSSDIERKAKVLERDNISEAYFDKREYLSIDYSPFKFDYIFENDYQLQSINNILEIISEQTGIITKDSN